MTTKTVSVIIPTHNYGRFIAQAVMSCLDQTYPHIDVIVVDDGSTDNTHSVIEQFGNRVTYVRQERKGVSSARNAGLERAEGDFISFLDADDYFLPDAIESMTNILEQHANVGVVAGRSYGKNENTPQMMLHSGWEQDRMSGNLYQELLEGRLSLTAPLIRGDLARRFRFPEHITNGEDIAYYTEILFHSSAYLLVKPVVVIVRHSDCLHRDISAIESQGASLIKVLLDDSSYRREIEHLKGKIKANVYLSLFRSFYIAGRGREGRKYYLLALRSRPASILQSSHLTKYVRTFFRSNLMLC